MSLKTRVEKLEYKAGGLEVVMLRLDDDHIDGMVDDNSQIITAPGPSDEKLTFCRERGEDTAAFVYRASRTQLRQFELHGKQHDIKAIFLMHASKYI